MRVVAYSRERVAFAVYQVPSRTDAIKHSAATMGSRVDKTEGKVTGGLPMVWPIDGEFKTRDEAMSSVA